MSFLKIYAANTQSVFSSWCFSKEMKAYKKVIESVTDSLAKYPSMAKFGPQVVGLNVYKARKAVSKIYRVLQFTDEQSILPKTEKVPEETHV